FLFSGRRRHTRFSRDWSSDVCSSDLLTLDQHAAVVVSDSEADGVWALAVHLRPRLADREDASVPLGAVRAPEPTHGQCAKISVGHGSTAPSTAAGCSLPIR